jgi:hypothetical protein
MKIGSFGPSNPARRGSIAAVVTICAQQKRLKVPVEGTPAGLDIQTQSNLELAWRRTVAALPAKVTAADLYAGRAFGLAKSAATNAASPLYVISAGLGLVPGEFVVPAYGLTIASNVPESISTKVDGAFDPAKWFSSLMAGSHSVGWGHLQEDGPGRILVALTRPYAEMAGASLAAAPPPVLERVRIFGANLIRVLPEALHSAVLPYDDRLDALAPGTRSDFAQRALLHFVEHLAGQPIDRAADAAAVRSALSHFEAPERPARMQRSDADLLLLIKGRITPRASASGMLRQLRDVDGIACEQGRFARLFRAAVADGRVG